MKISFQNMEAGKAKRGRKKWLGLATKSAKRTRILTLLSIIEKSWFLIT